jgi:hypothetical protein
MSAPCQCPGNTRTDGRPCPAPASQEDALCDWCRGLDCPTLDDGNRDERHARASNERSTAVEYERASGCGNTQLALTYQLIATDRQASVTIVGRPRDNQTGAR